MEDKRKAEDTVCPDLLVAFLMLKGVKQKQAILEEGLAACLGEKCQMWAAYLRACGKRMR